MMPYARAARNLTPPITIAVPSGTYEHYVTSGTAVCTLGFNSNGTCSVSSGVSPTAGNWGSGPGFVGSNYDISFDGGGSWNNLGTNRTISVSKAVGTGTTTATYNTQIRNASTLAVLATGSITLNATRDAG